MKQKLAAVPNGKLRCVNSIRNKAKAGIGCVPRVASVALQTPCLDRKVLRLEVQTQNHVPFRIAAAHEPAGSKAVQFDNTLVKTLSHLAAVPTSEFARRQNEAPASQKSRHAEKHVLVARLFFASLEA